MLVRLTDSNNRLILLETTNVVAVRPYSDELSIVETTAARGTSRTLTVLGSIDELAKLLSRRKPSPVFRTAHTPNRRGPHLVVHEGGRGEAVQAGKDDKAPPTS
jgi:hypothetical protein